MMHLFLNGLAASAGGGLTYMRNVIPHLSANSDVQSTVTLSPQLRQELGDLPNVSFLEVNTPVSGVRRFWQEQNALPQLIRSSGAEVLISAGNFALRKSPVPQILLSRNSLYTSSDFFHDVRSRRDYGIWLDTRLKAMFAKRSIQGADYTVAPSEAFAAELRHWAGGNIVSIHHGFDRDAFFNHDDPLPVGIRQQLDGAQNSLRLLFVSHYNYYRNFETLLRAIPLLRESLCGRQVKLFLTCRLHSADNPGSYRAEGAAALVRRLGIVDAVVELGAVPYRALHDVYRQCDVYVTAAYAESFAHPLVEAMASGLPVVASDTPVHQEICGEAALYFPRFSPDELAERVLRIGRSETLAQDLTNRGLLRAQGFSWRHHVEQIISLASGLRRSAQRSK
jgi:glycosyltransferase involved in cell wall biosynthesis